jgi:hypothetical protein
VVVFSQYASDCLSSCFLSFGDGECGGVQLLGARLAGSPIQGVLLTQKLIQSGLKTLLLLVALLNGFYNLGEFRLP